MFSNLYSSNVEVNLCLCHIRDGHFHYSKKYERKKSKTEKKQFFLVFMAKECFLSDFRRNENDVAIEKSLFTFFLNSHLSSWHARVDSLTVSV